MDLSVIYLQKLLRGRSIQNQVHREEEGEGDLLDYGCVYIWNVPINLIFTDSPDPKFVFVVNAAMFKQKTIGSFIN